uniref:Uncharacterized protein n=1 Tax=Vespula pensylvanica TaxID=30213 RepID=A0A834U3Y2_VESPE|nr:hypothetical protein H0235_012149 [Vespula pensylvanica]
MVELTKLVGKLLPSLKDRVDDVFRSTSASTLNKLQNRNAHGIGRNDRSTPCANTVCKTLEGMEIEGREKEKNRKRKRKKEEKKEMRTSGSNPSFREA